MMNSESKQHGSVCMSCGGYVDDDGMSLEMHEESVEHEMPEETGQQEATEKLRASAFTDAIRRRRSE